MKDLKPIEHKIATTATIASTALVAGGGSRDNFERMNTERDFHLV